MKGMRKNPDHPCWICHYAGKFQHGPAYWFLRWHLGRV